MQCQISPKVNPKPYFALFLTDTSSPEDENGGEAAIGEVGMPESAVLQSNGRR